MRTLLLLVALLALAPPAAAETRISTLYSSAEVRALADAPCRNAYARLVAGPPSDLLLATVGVLRRPPTQADRLPPEFARFPQAQRIYADHARVARTFEGDPFLLVPLKRRTGISAPTPGCQARVLRRVRRTAPRRVRARAVAYARRQLARDRRIAARTTDGVGVFPGDVRVVAQYGGPSAAEIAAQGAWGAEGNRVWILLPDGVAAIRVHYPAEEGAAAHVGDVAVEANLAIYRVPREERLEPQLAEWLDASGAVIRQVRMRDEHNIYP
jgi:hypothetical protein